MKNYKFLFSGTALLLGYACSTSAASVANIPVCVYSDSNASQNYYGFYTSGKTTETIQPGRNNVKCLMASVNTNGSGAISIHEASSHTKVCRIIIDVDGAGTLKSARVSEGVGRCSTVALNKDQGSAYPGCHKILSPIFRKYISCTEIAIGW